MPVAERHFVSGRRLLPPFPAGLELALFGMGCFWGAERLFWQLPGVWSTSVGYAGGFTPNPTYAEVCTGDTAHTEVVRVVFDPKRVSYGELLRAFWENHDLTQGMPRRSRRRGARRGLSGLTGRRAAPCPAPDPAADRSLLRSARSSAVPVRPAGPPRRRTRRHSSAS